MKWSTSSRALGLAWALLMVPVSEATAGHRHHHFHNQKRHAHLHVHETDETDIHFIEKRETTCAFPDDPDLVAVTPDEENGGWAMSPDQPCKADTWCPYACKSGMVMAQWDPDSDYTYPASMNGGLYCDKNGKLKQPFDDKPLCVKGVGNVEAVNECDEEISWCQTVLPGNEAMLIPTVVSSSSSEVIAVPDKDYWCGTAAHFYVNPPGSSRSDCKWGDDSSPIGNWSPYVAGVNKDGTGNTFVQVSWNPIFEGSGLSGNLPDYGVKIECPDGGCNGLPCEINPKNGGGVVNSLLSASGAGGSNFCVVTVPSGKSAKIVTFKAGSGGSGGDDDDDDDKEEEEEEQPEPELETTSHTPTPTPEPTTTKVPTTSQIPTTSSEAESTTSTPSTTPTPTSVRSTPSSTSTSFISVAPGIFHENGNYTSQATDSSSSSSSSSSSGSSSDSTSTDSDSDSTSETSEQPASTTSDKDGSASRSSAFGGLIIAFVAAVYVL